MLLIPFAFADDVTAPSGTHLGLGAGLETGTGSGLIFYAADLENGASGQYNFSWWVSGSARVRFAKGLTLEPDLACGTGSSTAVGDGEEQSFDSTDCRAGLSVRPLLASRRSLELHALIGAGFHWITVNWKRGDSEDLQYRVTTGDLYADGGIGAQKWLTDDVTLSIDVRVLTFHYGLLAQDSFSGEPWESQSWAIALDPGARLMLHLYW